MTGTAGACVRMELMNDATCASKSLKLDEGSVRLTQLGVQSNIVAIVLNRNLHLKFLKYLPMARKERERDGGDDLSAAVLNGRAHVFIGGLPSDKISGFLMSIPGSNTWHIPNLLSRDIFGLIRYFVHRNYEKCGR